MEVMKWERPAAMDLWEAFDGLRGDMDRALDLFKTPDAAGLLDRSTAPAVDLIETQDEYLVLADLPGVDRKDLELSVTGSLLSIKGEKKGERESAGRKFLRKEAWAGSFRRTIDLPAQIDASKIGAELKDGVLAVRIAKREEAKARLVEIAVK
jgi:HSP20 family protein